MVPKLCGQSKHSIDMSEVVVFVHLVVRGCKLGWCMGMYSWGWWDVYIP